MACAKALPVWPRGQRMSLLAGPGRGEFGRLFGARARTFSFASRFLPADRRQAVEALYAFCRTVDDLADEYPPDRSAGPCWTSLVAVGGRPGAAAGRSARCRPRPRTGRRAENRR